MLRRFWSRLNILLGGNRFRKELDEELSFHIDCLAQDLIKEGMAPSEARRQARIRVGSVERVKSRSREERGLDLVDEAARHFRFALRGLVRSPLHSTTFILTLALCIGLGTAAISVVDAVLWRPLPYPAPQQLAHAVLYDTSFGKSPGNTAVDGWTWERIRDEGEPLDRAVYSGWVQGVNLSTDEAAAYVQQQRIGAGFFKVLGVMPAQGREFDAAEDLPGGPPVAILSNDLWARTFNGDPDILGSTIRLKGEAHTVVGIMPADFRYHEEADVWTPLRPNTQGEGSGTNYAVLVRVPQGMSLGEAEARVASIAPPESNREDAPERSMGLVSLDQALSAGVQLPMLILLGSIALMLIVGCANLAGLQIARSLARRSEMATRQALGSGSAVLVRQMVVENLLLGLIGGAVGVVVAYVAMSPLEAMVQTNFGTWQSVHLDGRALGAAFAITSTATLLFGMVPVLQVANPNIQRILVTGSRSVVGGGSHLLRKTLLVGQVAMVTALLFGAGLLVRSYGHLDGLDPGFDPQGILTVQLSLDDARYAESENVLRLFEESLRGIREIPGVTSAAVALTLPYERPLNLPFTMPWYEPEDRRVTNAVYVTPEFIEVMGIPLLRGRGFEGGDREGAPMVALANQAFVDANLEGRGDLGNSVAMNFAPDGVEIVGVVGNVQQKTGGWGGISQPVWETPTLYLAAAQTSSGFFRGIHVWFSPSWIIKTGAGADLSGQVTRALAQVDPDLPMARTASLSEVMERAFSRQRFEAVFLIAVAALSLLLAGIGLYGIVAHEVLERRAEMGLRMALGSTPSGAVWTAGSSGLRLTLLGLVLGAVLAVGVSRVMTHMIWGVSPFDPVALVAIIGVLAALASTASFVPAARIGRMDPARALREGQT
jgi:predicted permease